MIDFHLNQSEDRCKLELELHGLIGRWVRDGFDIHRIWLIIEHVAMCRRGELEDLMIRDGQTESVTANIAREGQITGVGLPILGIDPVEAKLRDTGVGELLDAFEPRCGEDTNAHMEPAVKVLTSILRRVAAIYDDLDGLRECAWALSIASGVLEASLEEAMDKEAAASITSNIAGLADFLLNVEGFQNWDAATVAALKTIRNTNEDFADDDTPSQHEEVANV